MIAKVTPSTAHGTVTAPPSKSMAHRYLICAALSAGESVVRHIELSQDILATMDCIRAMGGECREDNGTVYVRGIGCKDYSGQQDMASASDSDLDSDLDSEKILPRMFPCRESGSTVRFFLPLSMLLPGRKHFTGSEVLMTRPMSVYEKLWEEQGLTFVREDGGITCEGQLHGGDITVSGSISSQFITGLLFTLPMLAEDSTIHLLPPVESRSYIELTLKALAKFGVTAEWIDDVTLFIKGGQNYKATEITTEGDYSNAAFLDALNLIGGEVTVEGLEADSLQGDKVYLDYYEIFRRRCNGKNADQNACQAIAQSCQGALPVMDLTDCPDLGPVLMMLAGVLGGAIFTGTKRLKIKESDRGTVMCEELGRFGIKTKWEEDQITVFPSNIHTPYEVLHGHNDHRIVMSLVLLSSIVGGEIDDAHAVNKSFPSFYKVMEQLGIQVEQYES